MTRLHGAKHSMSAGKYLTFALDGEEYAVSVLKVREIVKFIEITSVPRLPRYVKGVVNLRGKVIPVIDVRLKFGLAAKDYSDRTCIIVVEVAVRGSDVLMGLIVDSVSDVVTIVNDDLATPPDLDRSNEGWVEALVKLKGRLKILLNLDKMLGSDGDVIRAA